MAVFDGTPMARATVRRDVVRLLLASGAALIAGPTLACAPAPTPAPAAPTAGIAPKPTAGSTTAAPQPAAPTAAPKPAAPTAPRAESVERTAPSPKTMAKWRVGLPAAPMFDNAYRFMGGEKGYFREAGFEVEFLRATNPVTFKALVAGEVEIADSSVDNLLSAIEGGGNFKIVGTVNPGLPFVVYARSEIKQLADLSGRNIGINQQGDFFQFVMRGLFQDAGVDPEKATWVPLGGSGAAQFQALVAGKIDAFTFAMDFVPRVEREPSTKVLLLVNERLPKFMRTVINTSQRLIDGRRDDLVRFLGAYVRGVRYAIEHKDETVALAAKITGASVDDMQFAFDWYTKTAVMERNMAIPVDRLMYMQQLNIAAGAQKQPIPPEKLIEQRVIDDVLALIGRQS